MTGSAKALFLSYASEDSEAAAGICTALRAAGIEVWFDQNELRGGDAWDQKIRRQIRTCALFVPLISANTRSRTEGYFRLEWKLAVDRSHLMAADRAFLVPVAIDGSIAADATVPDRFRELQWIQLSAGIPTAEFIERITQLLDVASGTVPEMQASVVHRSTLSVPPTARQSVDRRGRGRVLAAGAAVALALLVGAGWLYHRSVATAPWVPSSTNAAMQHVPGAGNTIPASRPAAAPSGVSLAVLPFVDLSPEHNQDYFSDGLSEELLNQLAQIKELRVAGRTSSFSFKGKNEDLRVIGEQLGVNHLLEGSVRKDGKQLRITAQLINAIDGTHIWSQTYDRELNGIFAVQEEIAKDVSQALSITLDVGEMSRAKGGTTNVEAYDLYLRARTLLRQLGPEELLQSIQLYREALALDPNFARAWSGLYAALVYSLTFIPENSAAERKEMAQASAHIVALAPGAWWTQSMRADQFIQQHKWSEAGAAASAALASAPASEIQVLINYGLFLIFVGRAQEAVDYLRRARAMDPLSLDTSGFLQISLDCANRPTEAQAEYERSQQFAGEHGAWDWWAVQRLWSRKDAAPADVKAQFRVLLKHNHFLALHQIVGERLGNRETALTAVREAFKDPSDQDATRMSIVGEYADHFGDRDLGLAAYRRSYVELDNPNYIALWEPYETGLRSDPRFKDLLRDLGLVDYYRASGNWGDFCKPVGKDDFECH
jgi:TolB-like protein/Tfp pilus assembly protein PilF